MRCRQTTLPLVSAVALLTAAGTAARADAEYHYDAIRVDIRVLLSRDLEVEETYEVVFTRGPFHYQHRSIPLDRVAAIERVEVWEVGHRYAHNPNVRRWIAARRATGGSPGGAARAYSTWTEGGRLWIGRWFPQVDAGRQTVRLKYLVRGGVFRSGAWDRVHWKALFADRDVPAGEGRVTVHLPVAVPAERLRLSGHGAPARSEVVGSAVRFTTGRLAPGQGLEVEIRFPADILPRLRHAAAALSLLAAGAGGPLPAVARLPQSEGRGATEVAPRRVANVQRGATGQWTGGRRVPAKRPRASWFWDGGWLCVFFVVLGVTVLLWAITQGARLRRGVHGTLHSGGRSRAAGGSSGGGWWAAGGGDPSGGGGNFGGGGCDGGGGFGGGGGCDGGGGAGGGSGGFG